MVNTRYPGYGPAAILFVCLLLVLAGCAPKEKPVTAVAPAPRHEVVPAPSAALLRVQEVTDRALLGEDVDDALSELARIASQERGPVAEEAAFRRVQLLLRFKYPDAIREAGALITKLPDHALVPYTYLWLARWWEDQDDAVRTLAFTARALQHERLNREVAAEVLLLGLKAVRHAPDLDAVRWLLTAARALPTEHERLLQEAAARASIDIIARLRAAGWLRADTGDFYVYAAKQRLLRGRSREFQTILGFLRADAPGSEALATVLRWSGRAARPAVLGVMLPLSGQYAHFGEESLRGVRLALSLLGDGRQITLRVEDTGGESSRCEAAYQQLVADGAEMVLGPLLASCTRVLAPHVLGDTPVMSMTARMQVATRSPYLFVHSLSLPAQARFMAQDAWQRGDRRMVLVSADDDLSHREAEAFARYFQAEGGEITESLVLPSDRIDYRNLFRALRARTDDEELLARLDEGAIYLAEPGVDIRMPTGFDGMYLALPGRQVALVAGQLAYADITVDLFGSSHWHDGHLLDDKGRYLERAHFSDVRFPAGDMADVRQLLFAYREVWGEEKPGKLTGLAYDSARIAIMLTSRMGLTGNALRRELMDPSGFPGLTGQVSFDASGVGQKRFDVFTVRQGRLQPAG